MKTALIHDWLVSPVGGAENVLREMYGMFPSPIFTLLLNRQAFENTSFADASIQQSFIQRLPWSAKKFRTYLPLFPLAIEQFDLKEYELILSSSHCVAKGILTHSEQLHICYCHTPMRYAWDLTHQYLKEAGFKRQLARIGLHYLRGWDVQSSHRVDHFIANSRTIARRIHRAYGRTSDVIYPPVNTSFFQLGHKRDNFYLTASRLVAYKKIDMIVEAFSKTPERKLVVIGDGPEMKKIRKIAGRNVELMGYQPDAILRAMLQMAKALVFAALEDFGILPVEAMATGTPVIAFRRGGAAETIKEGATGLFFEEQSVASLCDALQRFEKIDGWDPECIRKHALQFSAERFREEYKGLVESKLAEFRKRDT